MDIKERLQLAKAEALKLNHHPRGNTAKSFAVDNAEKPTNKTRGHLLHNPAPALLKAPSG